MSSLLRVPNPRSTVLLICDVQERFRTAIHCFDAMNGPIAKMIKAARLLEMRVLATEQNPRALGVTVPEIGLADVPDNLSLGVIPKTKFSMMIPEVESLFTEHKFETAILVGIESHVCVLQTTLSLLRSGLGVYVLADAVSSCNRQEIPIALSRMRQAGAIVTTSESILFELLGDAENPNFKPVSNLVKAEKSSTATALRTLLDTADKPTA